MSDYFIKDENSKYNEGILLDDYQGNLSLVAAQEADDGKIYKRWVSPINKERVPATKSDGSPVMFPMGLRLGDPATAIAKLKTIIAMIEADTGRVDDDSDDGIPF